VLFFPMDEDLIAVFDSCVVELRLIIAGKSEADSLANHDWIRRVAHRIGLHIPEEYGDQKKSAQLLMVGLLTHKLLGRP